MNYPPQQAAGVSKNIDENFVIKASPPNVFIGGPVPVPSGFPIGAFGNDRLLAIIAIFS